MTTATSGNLAHQIMATVIVSTPMDMTMIFYQMMTVIFTTKKATSVKSIRIVVMLNMQWCKLAPVIEKYILGTSFWTGLFQNPMGKGNYFPVDIFRTVVSESPDCLLLSGTVVGENPDYVCWVGLIIKDVLYIKPACNTLSSIVAL